MAKDLDMRLTLYKDGISPKLEEWDRILSGAEVEKLLTQAAWIIARRATELVEEKKHVVTGTLWRSIHAAPPDADHSGDLGAASGGSLAGAYSNAVKRMAQDILTTEVGSWIQYAQYVEVLPDGGFLWIAFEEKFDEACKYLEAGLRRLLGL